VTGDYTQSQENIYGNYVKSISASLLAATENLDGLRHLSRVNFAIGSAHVYPCDFADDGLTFHMGDGTPTVTVQLGSTSNSDCNTPITIEFYAFKDPLFFQCSRMLTSTSTKGTSALAFTGLSSPDSDTVITSITGGNCPSGCSSSDGVCSCMGTSVLSYTNSIHNLFVSPSSFEEGGLLNITHNSLFWASLGLLIWLALHYNRKFFSMTAMDKFRASVKKTDNLILKTRFLVSLLISFMYLDSKSHSISISRIRYQTNQTFILCEMALDDCLYCCL
jgi:hypothetical protein